MKHLSVRSYAKINISLAVKGKREDGYHELDSIMLPLELHDSLLISVLKNATDNFVTVDDFSTGNIKYNLATFAIDKLASVYHFNQKFRIFIHKVIPIQAGLGGGSSNAAFTMLAVNKMLKLNISNEEMINIGKELGADIPFFINCVPQRAKGIGEILSPINVKNNYYCIIVKPHEGLSTADVFAKADSMNLVVKDIDVVQKALEEGDDELLAQSLFNSLEAPAISILPEIQTIKDELKSLGIKICQMSGSGSSVFGLSQDKKLINKVRDLLEDKYIVEVTKIKKN